MTAIRGYVPATDQPGLGVHSLDHFVLAVPDLAPRNGSLGFRARRARAGDALGLKTAGHDQRWGVVVRASARSSTISRSAATRTTCPICRSARKRTASRSSTRPRFREQGFWFRIRPACSSRSRSRPRCRRHTRRRTWSSSPEGVAGAPVRAKAPIVRPRRLSHVLVFTPDVDRSLAFYSNIVGLRLSDRSDRVAFMHAIHGSDHHILAFAQSSAPAAPLQLGHERYRRHRARRHAHGGQGLQRRLESRPSRPRLQLLPLCADPWGSYAEYSCDIDYIAAEQNWQAGSHPPEESFYLWGPEPPADFALNREL